LGDSTRPIGGPFEVDSEQFHIETNKKHELPASSAPLWDEMVQERVKHIP
jgi:hypothetical protein